MTEKPEALRLADALETLSPLERDAAAELRRLHTVNVELLEALQKHVHHFGDPLRCARAAIAKATGEQA